MTRVPTIVSKGPAKKATPGIYAVLLLIGILFLATGCAIVLDNLLTNYGLEFSQLFTSEKLPQ